MDEKERRQYLAFQRVLLEIQEIIEKFLKEYCSDLEKYKS
jgi:chloramphenicol O-acetyltransferase